MIFLKVFYQLEADLDRRI